MKIWMVEDLIRRARRRLVVNEALRQLAFAASVVIAGLVMLLILGTRYLEWWTLAIFAAAGVAIGAWRVYRGVPGQYATAVSVDRTAGLSDALSTAFYFSTHQAAGSEFQRPQREQAERAATAVDLDGAVPFTFPRALYAMAGLTLLASGLVVLRYGMGHGLDLRPPLTEVIFEDQAAPQAKRNPPADPLRRQRLEVAESLMAKLGVPMNPEDEKQSDALDKAIEEALSAPGAPAKKGDKGGSAEKSGENKTGNGAAQTPDGDPLNGKQADADQNGQNKPSDGKGGPRGDKGNSKNGSGDNSSLLSKLKDAVTNMFSKASEDNSGGKKNQPPPGQTAKSDKAPGDKGNTAKGREGENRSDDQDGEPSDDEQQGEQAQQGKAGDKTSQQSAQAGSGAGSQDGAKDVKAAEQLKAMGKISEIIGKRSATVSGETTIEVQSGNQQLRTAYSSKSAAHGDADSDVSRDEIPVSVQSYVQQYFEQVRKASGPQKAKAPESTP